MSGRSGSGTPIDEHSRLLLHVHVIMNAMAYCDLCDIDRDFCEDGLVEKRRNAAATRLLISPNGIAHFADCPHKGDHQDYRRWA